MQLPALRRTIGIHRFKKLHGRSHDNRRIPVFRGQFLKTILRTGFLILIKRCSAMVLHHIVFAQNISKNRGVLFYDGGIWNHIDHAIQPIFHSMLQGESQRRNGFPSAGRYCQRIDASRQRSLLHTGCKDRAPVFVQLRIAGKPRLYIGIQTLKKSWKRITSTALRHVSRHKLFRIQIVSVYQTGIQHPHPHGHAV